MQRRGRNVAGWFRAGIIVAGMMSMWQNDALGQYRQLTPIVPPNYLSGAGWIVWPEQTYEVTVTGATDMDEMWWQMFGMWLPISDWFNKYTWAGNGTFTPSFTQQNTTHWTPPDTPGADLTFTVTVDDSPKYNDTPVVFHHPADMPWETGLFIPTVTTVQLEACPGNPPLEGGGQYGGKRMFPDKLLGDDPVWTEWRRRVLIKARISPVHPNVPVYFRAWDVDDPSATGPPIDNGAQEDNRGSHSLQRLDEPPPQTQPVKTDANGYAYILLVVGLQPGDNYRVTACTNQGTLNAMTWAQANAGSAPKYGQTTELLTVWRKLRVECDSFGEPEVAEGEYIFDGNPKLIGNSTSLGQTVLEDSNNDWRPANQLVGGEVDPATNKSPAEAIEIIASSQTTIDTIAGSNLTANAAAYDPYEITVDDPDDGDVADPPTDVLSAAMEECFIKVETGTIWDCSTSQFLRNVPLNMDLSQHRGSGSYECGAYWAVYIIACYDGPVNMDNDIETEAILSGLNHDGEPEYSHIYMETTRDGYGGAYDKGRTVCHEIGHQFELYVNPQPHPTDGSVMQSGPNKGDKFNPASKDLIRRITYP